MKSIPSISNEINEDKIFDIINKNFSKLAPSYFNLITNWLIEAHKVYNGIDKFIILIYLINKNKIKLNKRINNKQTLFIYCMIIVAFGYVVILE